MWLHVSIKYVVFFKSFEQNKIQNHNLTHSLRVRFRSLSYCHTMRVNKIYKILSLGKLNIKHFYVRNIGIACCLCKKQRLFSVCVCVCVCVCDGMWVVPVDMLT